MHKINVTLSLSLSLPPSLLCRLIYFHVAYIRGLTVVENGMRDVFIRVVLTIVLPNDVMPHVMLAGDEYIKEKQRYKVDTAANSYVTI